MTGEWAAAAQMREWECQSLPRGEEREMIDPVIDTAAIVAALREYNAAGNSWQRALAELRALLPPGLTVLHRLPGKVDGPDTVYWSWESSSSGGIMFGAEKGPSTTRAVIVEAPPPTAEYLPRLGEGSS